MKQETAQEKTSMFNNVMDTYNQFSKAMDDTFYEEYVPKLNDAKLNKLVEDYRNGKIHKGKSIKQMNKLYHEFYSSALPNSAIELNNLITEYNMGVYYFPKTN